MIQPLIRKEPPPVVVVRADHARHVMVAGVLTVALGYLWQNVIDAAAAAYIPQGALVGNGFFTISAVQAFHLALWASYITLVLGVLWIGWIALTGKHKVVI